MTTEIVHQPLDDFVRFSISNVALARVYSSDGRLLGIVPNVPGKAPLLKILYDLTDKCKADQLVGTRLDTAINMLTMVRFWPEDYEAASDLLSNTDRLDTQLNIDFVKTEQADVLEAIINGTASAEQKFEGLRLLDQGEIRTAEKISTDDGGSFWQPQGYAIDALNAAFGLFQLGSFPGQPWAWDKIPLKTQKVTLKDGVASPYYSTGELQEMGVRFVPGSFARFGAYIGKGTTIMSGGIVNIGAYVAGNGVMIDGGARVASGAQVGEKVKIGAGSGLEGVLEPKGMMPTIVEDGVRIGANCEVTGIIEEGALIASGTVLAGGKKIYDLRTGEMLEPRYVQTKEGVRAIPYIPKDRIAVSGVCLDKKFGGNFGKACILLLEKKASESNFMEIPKNPQLYV